LRQLRRDGNSFREDGIQVTCNPEIADLLINVEAQYIEQLEKRLQKKIVIQAKKRFHLEKFEISGRDPEANRSSRQEAAADGEAS
jgi:Ribonuclease G/E